MFVVTCFAFLVANSDELHDIASVDCDPHLRMQSSGGVVPFPIIGCKATEKVDVPAMLRE